MLHFYVKQYLFTYILLKASMYFMNKIWDMTNSDNQMQIPILYFIEKSFMLEVFWRNSVLIVIQWHI